MWRRAAKAMDSSKNGSLAFLQPGAAALQQELYGLKGWPLIRPLEPYYGKLQGCTYYKQSGPGGRPRRARLSHSCDLSKIGTKVPASIRIPVPESPAINGIAQFEVFVYRADGRPHVTSQVQTEQQRPPLVSVTNNSTPC